MNGKTRTAQGDEVSCQVCSSRSQAARTSQVELGGNIHPLGAEVVHHVLVRVVLIKEPDRTKSVTISSCHGTGGRNTKINPITGKRETGGEDEVERVPLDFRERVTVDALSALRRVTLCRKRPPPRSIISPSHR